MQGCPKLNVIRPSRTPPKAVRSAHGKWKPKCCILYIFWNKTVLSHCLKVKLKCQHFSTMAWSTSEPLQGPKCTIFAVFLSKVKALRSLFGFYPHAYRVGNIFFLFFGLYLKCTVMHHDDLGKVMTIMRFCFSDYIKFWASLHSPCDFYPDLKEE